MNIVFVGAHQDDEAQALGTLIKYHRLGGHRISLICSTNGDKGFTHDNQTPLQVVAATRDREIRAVASALGAEYICLGAEDEFLFDCKEMRLKMIDALRACRAQLIFTHNTSEYNLDHTTTSWLVFQTSMLSVVDSVRTQHAALKDTPRIFYCDPGPGDEGYGFEGTHFVELNEEIVTEKVRLINMHESQTAVVRQESQIDYAETYREHARRVGTHVGVQYAEAFRACIASRRTPQQDLLP
jgi:LmbE family N-acetylglucosaminyl deacetylase